MVSQLDSERDRIVANVRVLAALLDLSEKLRRTTPDEWSITHADWEAAVQAVVTAPIPFATDSAAATDAIRAAQGAARRLGKSGDARFGSASVGRNPDSSIAGRRFYDDIKTAAQRLASLQELAISQ